MANILNNQVATIKVVGIGGAGNNAVNRMIEAGVEGVQFIVMNTDAQVLNMSKASVKLVLGKQVSRGLGAGADPAIGKEAAVESLNEIKQLLKGADMVFLAAGMGGGTGTGAAPIIAKAARDLGILTIAIVTKPFSFEGKVRNVYALEGMELLQENVDSLITISNDRLLEIIGGVPLKDSFKEADNILRQGVQTITDLIAVPALINLDFADIRTVLQKRGSALFGVGIGSAENKAIEASNKAITSPLLEASFKGAKNAIVNVTGGSTMTLYDANDAVDIVRQAAGGEINIIFGVAINEHLKDQMIVTVIATGFDNAEYKAEKTDETSVSNSGPSSLRENPAFFAGDNSSTFYKRNESESLRESEARKESEFEKFKPWNNSSLNVDVNLNKKDKAKKEPSINSKKGKIPFFNRW